MSHDARRGSGGSRAAGRRTGQSRAVGRGGEAGLTLLEMLIVLAVIAVVAGATVLNLAPRRGNATEAAARQLAMLVQGTVDRSIVTGAAAVLVADDGGYRLDDAARATLPGGTTLTGVPPGGLRLAFDGGRPFDLVVAAGSDRWTVSFDGVRAAVVRGAAEPT